MRKAHASKYIQKLTFIVVREFDGRALALPVPLPVSRPIPEREGYRHVEIVGWFIQHCRHEDADGHTRILEAFMKIRINRGTGVKEYEGEKEWQIKLIPPQLNENYKSFSSNCLKIYLPRSYVEW